MLIRSTNSLTHWGIKGMKWDNKKKQESVRIEGGSFGGAGLTEEQADLLAQTNGLTKMWGYDKNGNQTGMSGYSDHMGNKYPINLDKAIAAKKNYDRKIANYKVQSKNGTLELYKSEIKPTRTSMVTKAKNISSSTISKGKAVVDKLFNRGLKISPANAIRKKNNTGPM